MKFLAKKIVFLVSSGQNEVSPLLPRGKTFWLTLEKSICTPSLEKILPMPIGVVTVLYNAVQSIT